ATDSATLDRRRAKPRRVSETPKIQSPAEPIARGMGLDRPFFDDKNRAFWILQSIGWSGYFFLRSLSGFANSMSWIWLVHTFLLVEDESRQREKLEGQASTAQLAMLRYQLNPHFLFNTLNSISTLVLLKQTERANAMLARLSSFLRYTLANEPTAKVTLAQEV